MSNGNRPKMSAKTKKIIRDKAFERSRHKVDEATREWARAIHLLNQKKKGDDRETER